MLCQWELSIFMDLLLPDPSAPSQRLVSKAEHQLHLSSTQDEGFVVPET